MSKSMPNQNLELQKALRGGVTYEELKNKYAISSIPHSWFSNLILFKYSMIDSPLDEKIVQESRGIILDKDNNWGVVCRSYDKFFNYGEGRAANLDWSSVSVQEKVDGSLCQLYFYNWSWNVATSGTPDAGGKVNGYEFTFADLFWKVWDENKLKLTDLDRAYCYAFELCTPYNKVVVQHKENKLVLIGARNLISGQEISPNTIFGFSYPKTFPLTTIEECLESMSNLDPLAQEGYVACDKNFNRVKIKHPGYVALHHIKGSFSLKNLLTIVKSGEINEFNVAFPEYKKESDLLTFKYNQLIENTNHAYQKIKHLESQKEFALEATKYPFSGVLFQMRKENRDNSKQVFSLVREEYLLKWMKI